MEEEVITELNELIKMESQDSYEESVEAGGGLLTTDPACIMQQFETESDLEVLQAESSEMLQSNNLVFNDISTENVETSLGENAEQNSPTEEIIVQLMDIRTRLSKLKTILENRTNADLSDYEFWLQDAKMLESHKTLVEQCIRGEGVVQVNIQLRPQQRRINILDVLKPDEELVHLANDEETDNQILEDSIPEEVPVEQPAEETPSASPLVKWIVDAQFKADQERLRIPEDPALWTVPQVRLWIQWAVRQFNLSGIKLSDWSLSGDQLCALTLLEFKKKCPLDPGDVFWTHFELLRKCKFIGRKCLPNEDGQCEKGRKKGAPQGKIVLGGKYPRAVIQNEDPNIQPPEQPQSAIKKKIKIPTVNPKPCDDDSLIIDSDITISSSAGSGRTGNNGQVQLWQFLLELLTSADHLSIIQWHGSDGEFKLSNPEVVARLWGARKHKPAMNYEKLSRALRYYYDGDMIAKVSGKRFVYKFVCDLKQLIGYDAGELSRLVHSVSQSPSENLFDEIWT